MQNLHRGQQGFQAGRKTLPSHAMSLASAPQRLQPTPLQVFAKRSQPRQVARNSVTGKPIHFESTLLGSGGRRWQVAWDSMAVRDEEGKVKAVANIGRDIT